MGHRWNQERFFYLAMGSAILVAVFIGFAPTFYLRETGPPLRPLLQAHGIVFSSWLLLFLTQTALIGAGRTDVHRRLGVAGALLAIAMLVLGTLTALGSVAGVSGPEELAFLAIPLFDVVVFALLVGTALSQRQVPQTHKRLMLIATIGLLSPATGRMPWPESLRGTFSDFVVPDLFLVPLIVRDLVTRRGRVHPATIFGGLLLVGSQVVRMALSGTDGWLRFAEWAARLFA